MFRKLILALTFVLLGNFSLLSNLQADNTSSKKTVTLLVSLDPKFYPHGISSWIHDYSQYPAKLESTFRTALVNSNFDLEVIQNATRYDLFEALHSSDNVAVFWVSHAAPTSFSKPGISIAPELVDVEGADEKVLFKNVNPGIQWISLVACDSDVIINWLNGQTSQQNVTMQGFDKVIDANRGLKQAVQLSLPALAKAKGNNTESTESSQERSPENSLQNSLEDSQNQDFPITIRRTYTAQGSTAYLPAVTIEYDGEAIAALPDVTLAPGQSISQETSASSSDGTLPNRLMIQSGLSELELPAGFQMGTYEITDDRDDLSWKVFAKSDGTPLGVTERLFLNNEN